MSHLETIATPELDLIRGGAEIDCVEQHASDQRALNSDFYGRQYFDGPTGDLVRWGFAKAGYSSQDLLDFDKVQDKIDAEYRLCKARQKK
jgi:hypothetical protein